MFHLNNVHPTLTSEYQAARCQDPRVEGGVLAADGGHTACAVSIKCATTVMSAEKDASISNTYPVTLSLINIRLMRTEGDRPGVIEFKTKVRSSVIKRMNVQSDEFVSSAPMISSMLDPGHKHLGFLRPTQRVAANAKLVELGEAVETDQEAIPQAGGEEAALWDINEESGHPGLCYGTAPGRAILHSM